MPSGQVTPDSPAMDQPLFSFREIIALLGSVMVTYKMQSLSVPLKAIGTRVDDFDWHWTYKVENGVIALTKTNYEGEHTNGV